jgi:hypothetical protein
LSYEDQEQLWKGFYTLFHPDSKDYTTDDRWLLAQYLTGCHWSKKAASELPDVAHFLHNLRPAESRKRKRRELGQPERRESEQQNWALVIIRSSRKADKKHGRFNSIAAQDYIDKD